MKRMPRWLLGCLVFPMVGLMIFVAMITLLTHSMEQPGSNEQLVEIVEEHRDQATNKIVVIPVKGVISGEGANGGLTGYVLSALARAQRDPQVKAIILEIDSPGGGVTDSDRIHHALSKAKSSGKEIYALFGNLCASGGYYIAVGADKIWSRPTSITGSIGVIVPSYSAQELFAKLGIRDQSVSSGANKQILSATKSMTSEQVLLMQSLVDEMHGRFVSLVAKGRGLAEADVEPIADGRLLTAEQALKAKLVDVVGYKDDLITEIRESANEELLVVRYQAPQTFIEILMGNHIQSFFDRVIGRITFGQSMPAYVYPLTTRY